MRQSSKGGFTLVELLMAIAIIGLLASISLVATKESRAKARDASRISDMAQIGKALDLFFADHGHYPGRSVEGVALKGEFIGDNMGPIETALLPYFQGGVLPKDPRHDGEVYFYSYDPVHCLVLSSSNRRCNASCGAEGGRGVTVAFNKAETDSGVGRRKDTFVGVDMNQGCADYVAGYTPHSP